MKQWGLTGTILAVILCLLLTAGLGVSVMQYRRQEKETAAELQVKAKEAQRKEQARARIRSRIEMPDESAASSAESAAAENASAENASTDSDAISAFSADSAAADGAATDSLSVDISVKNTENKEMETSSANIEEQEQQTSEQDEVPAAEEAASEASSEQTEPKQEQTLLISCRGDSWQQMDGADKAQGWPAALEALLESENRDAKVYDETWDMAGTLSQLRYAGVPAEVTDAYIAAHQAGGLGDIRTETIVRDDLEQVFRERTDTAAIPVICMGYYGGFGQKLDELIEQQEAMLETYDLQTDDNMDTNDGSKGIKGKYLILGYLPVSMGDTAGYDAAMEEAWGSHYLSLNVLEENVFSEGFRRSIAEAVREKMEELQYL